jgi:hypothetical protein
MNDHGTDPGLRCHDGRAAASWSRFLDTAADAAIIPRVDASVDAVVRDLQARVRERVRASLVRHGASGALADPALFEEIDAMLRAAVDRSRPPALLLPELLGDPATWRLAPAIRFVSHRGSAAGPILFVKRRLIMPLLRFFYDYSRDNFERQRRVNDVLFACVQELAIETARLRQEVRELSRRS